jgi:SM-20-related protein
MNSLYDQTLTPMEKEFEILIHSFMNDKIGICNDFLSTELSTQLKENLLNLLSKQLLVAAGTGNKEMTNHDTLIRSDSIYWLDKKNNNIEETKFLNLMEDFITYLNMSCYTGITSCEFHYSLYEAGSFYKKHRDQFKNNESRQYSMISYLNADWQTTDGGELKIHHLNSQQLISPLQGKTVFFKSNEIIHEVLETNQRRMSVTGWLKKD